MSSRMPAANARRGAQRMAVAVAHQRKAALEHFAIGERGKQPLGALDARVMLPQQC